MATRREFLTTSAGIATALSGASAAPFAAEQEETAPVGKQEKSAKPEDKRPPLRLHLLGCGYPPPSGSGNQTRHGSAFLLEVGPGFLMLDCGPATTYKMARMGISTKKVNHVFLTHHHFDHNVDLPCFALVRWDLCKGTESPLKVYGPPPTSLFVEQLFGEKGAFLPDWNSRVRHPVSIRIFQHRGGVPPRPAPAFETRDVEPGRVEETASWTATAARVHHVEPTLVSLAYRFDTDQGSIVFAGDCGDCPELRELAQGAETLVAPCVSVGSAKAPSYLDGIIMGAHEVREVAKAAGVRRVVLSHNGGANSPERRKPYIEAVAEVFSGEVLFPDELTTIDLLS
jgi:ribonuclease BN (tRNA processing enzyme)